MDVLERFSIPTKYDSAPYGALCSVKQDDNTAFYYIQTSNDPDVAHWERIGEFLEHLFLDVMKDVSFRKECLTQYAQEKKDLKKIAHFFTK